MTKIYFIGDTHFGKSYPFLKDYELNISKRNYDVIDNCEKIIKDAIKNNADYVIFLGDLYERQTISATIRRIVRERIFRPLHENNIPVIIIGGNHDSIRNPKRGADIQELSNFPNVSVFTEFTTKIIDGSNGEKIGLVLMPFIHFDVLCEMALSRGMEIPKDQHNYIIAQNIIESYVSQVCEGSLKNCNKRILIGHYYLEGAKIRETNNPLMIYGEFKFNRQMVQKEKFDLVIFGHVHLRQELWGDKRIIIPGSIDRIDMDERDSDKYYTVYSVGEDDLQFHEIDCRKLLKINIDIPDKEENYTQYILDQLPDKGEIVDALCKISIKHLKGKEVKIDKIEIEDYLKDCFYANIHYSEKAEAQLQYLREVDLNPISLLENFLEQKYSDYKYYKELKEVGVDILKNEFSMVDLPATGPISIKSVEMRNFNNYGSTSNKVVFDDNLYVITGPTGSGKSSILDAITFAIFKSSTRTDVKLTMDNILYEGGFVAIEMEVGDNLLYIKRSKRNPKLTTKLNGADLYKGLSITEKERNIANMIGYDYKGFTSSFFIRQQELQIFSMLTSAERQKRLSNLFKLDIFDKADKVSKTKLDKLNLTESNLIGEIKGVERIIEELPELKNKLNQENKTYKTIEKQWNELDNKSKDITKLLNDLIPKASEYERIQHSIREIEENIQNIKVKIEENKEEQQNVEGIQKRLKEYKDIKEIRDRLEIHRATAEEKRRQKADIENVIKSNKEILNSYKEQSKSQLDNIQTQLKGKMNRLKEINPEISKDDAFNILKTGGVLTERLDRLQNIEIPLAKEYKDEKRVKEFQISQEKTQKALKVNIPRQKLVNKDIFIGDELQTEQKRLEKELNQISTEFRDKINKIELKVDSLNKEILKKKLTENFDEELEQIDQQLQDLKNKEEEKIKLENQLRDLQDLSALIQSLNSDLNDMKVGLTEKQEKGKELKDYYDKYRETNDVKISVDKELSEIAEIKGSAFTKVKDLKVQIEKAEKFKREIKEIQKQLEIIKKDQEIYSEFRKNIFHQNGVPMFAMKKILPAIEIRASEILSDLTDAQLSQITFKEFETVSRVGFDIYVHDGTQEREATSFSGGEKTQINAAIRFAIMERIAEIPDTAGAIFRKSNTLFIDEGDLGTLDDDVARKRFIDKILELEKMFKKIILITHLEDVAVQFPNRIRIGRDEQGKSKIYN